MEWNSIKTAPIDQHILVYDPSESPYVNVAFCDISGWMESWSDGIFFGASPTHWMPLPEQPENNGETA